MSFQRWQLVFLLWLCAPPAMAQAEPYEELRRADSLSEAGHADSALGIARAFLSAYDEAAADTTFAWVVHRMGNYHFTLGDLDSAAHYWTRAHTLYEAQQAAPIKRIGVLNNLAILENMRGRILRSAFAFEEALELHRQFGTDTTRDAANVMNNLASTYDELGRAEEALALYEESGRIWRRLLGDTHWAMGLNLSNRGLIYYKRGQDGAAEQCFREALRILESSLGRDHLRLAGPETPLASLLMDRGRLEEAQEWLTEALRVTLLNVGETHPELIAPLDGLGNLHRRRGEYRPAEEYFRRALAVARANGGDTSLATAGQLHNVALSLADQRRFDEADALWDSAVAIWTSQGHATSYEMLKTAQERLRVATDPAAIAKHTLDVARLVDTLYGEQNHPARGSALLALADRSYTEARWSEAAQFARQAVSLYLKILADNARYLNERDALAAGHQLLDARDLCLRSLLAESGRGDRTLTDPHLVSTLAAVKGITTDVMATRIRVPQAARSANLDSLEAEYSSVRVAIAGQFADSKSWQLAADRLAADSLRRLADSLESVLAARRGESTPPLRTELPLSDMFANRADIVLVDFVRVLWNPESGADSAHYVAMVHSAASQMRLVDLGATEPIDSLVGRYRGHLLSVARRPGVPGSQELAEYTELAGALRELVWDPLETGLPHRTREHGSDLPLLLVACDGQLGLVSFGTLPDSMGFLADRFRFRYVSSLREWQPRREASDHSDGGLLALGDPAFDHSPSATPDEFPNSFEAGLRSPDDHCTSTNANGVSRLPSSRYEAEKVASDWRGSGAGPVTLLLGEEASEESLRAEVPGKRALHLATHGYYLDPSCDGTLKLSRGAVHPLLLSGLFLAGANKRLEAASAEQDGVLSAYEIIALPLDELETVVLSACESGIGTEVASEGLYGLRYAFRLAGAQAVICSLWPVSDRYTAAFMSRLYASGETSVARRLDAMQREERERLKQEGLAEHPLTWGAFIVFGAID